MENQKEKVEIWQQVLDIIEQNTTQISFETWFKPLRIRKIDRDLNIVYLELKSDKGKDFIIDTIKKRYMQYLQSAFKTVMGEDFRVVLKDSDEYEREAKMESVEEPIIEKTKAPQTVLNKQKIFNPKYNFENFVVGSSNKYAHAAALAVAESPSEAYNPLFIYGPSGLGKTHLLYAIANVVRRDHPSFRIIYIKGEDFTNELVNSIGAGQVQEFRDKYRLADLLLVDDIQFVAGKDRTQEEFFHTFNALYEANKQIVLTSDRPPKEIHTLEDRLKTRFEWGLLADIQPPDYETRMAIIHVKADSLRVQLPENVVDYIAKTITSNVRQLEGTVKKIKALHDLMERAIDIELAKEAVADIFKENPGLNPTPDMILREVSRYYCTPVEKLKGSGRSKDLVLPRQVAMYLVRDLTDYSLPEIGKIFSRDHTTVLHSINKIENYLKETSEMDNIIKTLKTNIRG